MTAIELTTKTCTGCGVNKPVSQFYRVKSRNDGLSYRYKCAECEKQYQSKYKAKYIKEHGLDAWKERRYAAVKRFREANPDEGRETREAYRAADAILREAHRKEFDALLRVERYNRGLPV